MDEKIGFNFCIFMMLLAASRSWAVQTHTDRCDVKSVASAISGGNVKAWNQGRVRSRDVEGGFWSLALTESTNSITKKLADTLSQDCELQISDVGAYSVRTIPKGAISPKGQQPSKDSPVISPLGTTLGLLNVGSNPSPTQSPANLVIIYPANVASEIASGGSKTSANTSTNTSLRTKLPIDKNLLQKFTEDLEIEYNFGNIQINILGLTGQFSLKDVAEKLVGHLRKQGFEPHPMSDNSLKALDGFWPPQSHESFWIKPDSILRLEVIKVKRGNVKVNLHESKQIRQ